MEIMRVSSVLGNAKQYRNQQGVAKTASDLPLTPAKVHKNDNAVSLTTRINVGTLVLDTVKVSLASAALITAASIAPLAASAVDAPTQFTMSCAGCHAGGGNIVRPAETLKLVDLQKNNLADPGALYDLIYNGRGPMPGFGEGCAPKMACTFAPRLSDDSIKDLATYVLDEANAGWPAAK